MKKSKKVLSGVLAVLMLVSMLACFILPATAEEQTNYFVTSYSQWNTLASSNIDWTGKTIHIQSNISFEGVSAVGQFGTFAGTLDGHGYKFTNITTDASLIETLTGTIQDLTLDSTCSFTNTDTDAQSGAFAASANGGKIYKCASYATYIPTGALGGFVGAASGGTIDGCIFAGTGATNAFAADSTGTTIQYSYPHDTITEVKEAVWTINSVRESETESCEIYLNVNIDGLPCFGDANNRVVRLSTTIGDTTTHSYYAPRSVINTRARNEETKEYYITAYNNVSGQTEIIPEVVEGMTAVVTGAEYREGAVWQEGENGPEKYTGKVIYVDNRDITLEYVETEEYERSQTKAKLKALVDAYEAMNHDYFTDWAAKQAWLDDAKSVLQNSAENIEALQTQIAAEDSIDGNVVEMTDPEEYPSVSKYNTYKYIESIKDYKVTSKQDWLDAVAMSNYVTNSDAVNFAGVTLHLTADINMEKSPMMPLCYGWIFDGNLDGHDHVFKNINIVVDSAYGPVGLIGVIGDTTGRFIQNLGIESGNVRVTGWPRYKATLMSISDAGNKVGGIVGKNRYGNTNNRGVLIRKCWNNAEVKADNRDQAAGIIGDPRNYAVVDSCFNVGKVDACGIQGYGRQYAIVCNSFSGISPKSAVLYPATLLADGDAYTLENRIINVCGVRSTLTFNHYSDNAETKAEQQAEEKAYNTTHNEMSDAAAAWKVNKNYALQSYGNKERIYYTLNENGEVRFGKSDGSDQIYRIQMVCDKNCDKDENLECADHPTQYAYGVAGREIALTFDVQANYYACADENVNIRGNKLVFSNDSENTERTFTVYVGYDADRGNVNNDDKSVINVQDVLDAARMVADKIAKNPLTADVDSDCDVDIQDAYHIVRYWIYGKSDLFVPGLPTESKTKDYLKILSYNIKAFHYDPNTDSAYNNGTAMCRYNAVMTEIEAIQADIIGFQELDRYNNDTVYDYDGDGDTEEYDHLRLIAERLMENPIEGKNYQFFLTVPDKKADNVEGDGYGHGIVSKYPILEYGEVRFAGMMQMVEDDPQKMLDGTEPRGFGWYKLDINLDNKYNSEEDIVFYNCHLATYTAAQLRYMTTYMKNTHPGERIVCTGDFNLNAFEAETAFDRNSFTLLNGGKNFDTFIRTAVSGSMIDHILVSNNVEYFTPSASETGLNTSTAVYSTEEADKVKEYGDKKWSASDHLPIWAYIKK